MWEVQDLSAKPHLHYEVMKDGKYVDPADYLGQPIRIMAQSSI
jgi:murein DD-endopeptidase MepM/ murein hydrolase activator NlpD